MKDAYYNTANCETIVSCAAELQGLVLENELLAGHPTLLPSLIETLREVKEFIAVFSSRYETRVTWR